MGLSRRLGNRVDFRPPVQKQQKDRPPMDDELSDDDTLHSTTEFTQSPLFSNPFSLNNVDTAQKQINRDMSTAMNARDTDNVAINKQNTPSSLLSAAKGILGSVGHRGT